MKRINILSSIISSVGYDKERMILEIEFSDGSIYHYFNVPENIFQEFIKSTSYGKYFFSNIKGAYANSLVSAKTIREIEFMVFLSKLMEANKKFSDISINPLYKDKNERIIRPDIVCKYNNKKLLIKTKSTAPLIEQRIYEYINQVKQYKDIDDGAQIVLAFPSELSINYKEILTKENITVWDLSRLASIFYDQLDIIKDTLLYQLLFNVEKNIDEESLSKKFINELENIRPGHLDWVEYQKLCFNIFEYLFTPPLAKPLYDLSDSSNTNRKDIIIPNYANDGFWRYMREKYFADYIVIDAKNYSKAVQKEETLQVLNYLKGFGTGLFGLIVSRKKPKMNAILTQREHWITYSKLIIFLEDGDLIQMLIMKENNEKPEEVLRQKIEEFRLSL